MAPKEHYLVGYSRQKLLASRDPLNLRKLLQNMIFENIEKEVPLKDSVKLVVKNAMVLWKQSGIATIRTDHIEEKLEKEYMEWRRLNRNKHLISQTHKDRCDAFTAKLDLEFDVRPKRKTKVPVTAPSDSPETVSMATEQGQEEPFSFEIEEIGTEASGSDSKKKRRIGIETIAQEEQTSENRPYRGGIHESK